MHSSSSSCWYLQGLLLRPPAAAPAPTPAQGSSQSSILTPSYGTKPERPRGTPNSTHPKAIRPLPTNNAPAFPVAAGHSSTLSLSVHTRDLRTQLLHPVSRTHSFLHSDHTHTAGARRLTALCSSMAVQPRDWAFHLQGCLPSTSFSAQSLEYLSSHTPLFINATQNPQC